MASLNNNTNYINTLVSAGDDAHSNLYVARFTSVNGFLKNNAVAESLTIRCDGFTPPATSQAPYSVSFMNQTIERPTAKVDVTRNFALTFRVDAEYITFKALLDQQGIIFNPAKSYTATNIKAFKDAGYLFDVSLEVAGGLENTTPVFTQLYAFKNCWISKITPIAYKTASSEAATVTMTINFLNLEDIHSGFGTAAQGAGSSSETQAEA